MKLLSPALYFVASLLAAVACVWTVVLYLSDLSWVPYPVFFAIPFPFVGVVLMFCAWGLLWLERSSGPTPWDHVRHCVFLYVGLVLLVGSWTKFFFYDKGETLAMVEFGVFFYVSLAILANALALVHRGRRRNDADAGAAA